MIIKFYLKRRNLIEKKLKIESNIDKHLAKWLLVKELEFINKKLKDMKKKRIIKNIRNPEFKSKLLFTSKKSIEEALEKLHRFKKF